VGCTAGANRRGTCRPTCQSWDAHPWRWFARAPKASWTYSARWKCWRRRALRCGLRLLFPSSATDRLPLVQVAALGSDEFPAFYTRSSGVRAPWRLETPAEAAAAIAASARMGLAGCVIGVPIPAEHAAEGAVVEEATQCAPLRGAQHSPARSSVCSAGLPWPRLRPPTWAALRSRRSFCGE